jgi:hypothetical protein
VPHVLQCLSSCPSTRSVSSSLGTSLNLQGEYSTWNRELLTEFPLIVLGQMEHGFYSWTRWFLAHLLGGWSCSLVSSDHGDIWSLRNFPELDGCDLWDHTICGAHSTSLAVVSLVGNHQSLPWAQVVWI